VSCHHPIKAFRTPDGVVFNELRRHGNILGDIELPCGQCIGCRMRRASDWALRVMHEASSHPANCFITLTYRPGALPANASLEHGDFQAFMKRLRKSREPGRVRFYMCGEYGPENGRPHYHACLFNVDFADRVPAGKSKSGEQFFDSPELDSLWGHGKVSVQDLTRETASYCARYIMKKILGQAAKNHYETTDPETGEIQSRRPEYAAMSLKPGIGAAWYSKYGRDIYPHDFAIQGGQKHAPPKYYDKLLKRQNPDLRERIALQREAKGILSKPEQTPERREAREKVQLAKVSTLKRNL